MLLGQFTEQQADVTLIQRLLQIDKWRVIRALAPYILRLYAEVNANLMILPLDVADDQQMAQAEQRLKRHVDSLDMAIICAGTCEYQNGWRVDSAMQRRVFNTNYFGPVNTARVALPLLKNSRV